MSSSGRKLLSEHISVFSSFAAAGAPTALCRNRPQDMGSPKQFPEHSLPNVPFQSRESSSIPHFEHEVAERTLHRRGSSLAPLQLGMVLQNGQEAGSTTARLNSA
mmetsp:Transcript_45455/g.103269  ORF Transcript_45455/g.103269 Transcript_45455/m.103269 type:complete len:105 (-) Transcript_45455:81-395(-)